MQARALFSGSYDVPARTLCAVLARPSQPKYGQDAARRPKSTRADVGWSRACDVDLQGIGSTRCYRSRVTGVDGAVDVRANTDPKSD